MLGKILNLLSLAVILITVSACSAASTPPALPLPQVADSPLLATAVPLTASQTPHPTQVNSPTPTPTITQTATPTATPLPDEFYIRDISGHRQYFTLGCEAATAKDWANFFGYDFNEFEFQYRLPLSDNPEFGFVGDVNAPWGQVPPYGYGVHAGPVADLLNKYGIPARAYKEYTLDQILEKIAQSKPVIAWVIGNVVGGVPYEYTDSKGNQTIVAAYQHVIIVTGYNAEKIRYMTNGRFFEAPREVFLNSWGVLRNMVLVDE